MNNSKLLAQKKQGSRGLQISEAIITTFKITFIEFIQKYDKISITKEILLQLKEQSTFISNFRTNISYVHKYHKWCQNVKMFIHILNNPVQSAH